MHYISFGGRARPGPAGGAYSAPPDPLAGFRGPTSKGRGGEGGRGGERTGREGTEWRKERGGEGRKGGKGGLPLSRSEKFLVEALRRVVYVYTSYLR